MNPSKRCTDCRRTLPLEAFHRRTASEDGLQGRCKGCISAYQARRRSRLTRARNLDTEIDDGRRLPAPRNGRPWTPNEIAWLEEHPELTARQAAIVLGRTREAVNWRRSILTKEYRP